MALAGFYYTPTKDYHDQVTCFCCGTTIDGWQAQDDPRNVHISLSPECSWAVIQFGRSNFDSIRSHKDYSVESLYQFWSENPQFSDPFSEESTKLRKNTFYTYEDHIKSCWPHEKKRGWKVTLDKIVDAGFYYLPTQSDDDVAACMYCGLSLEGWEPKDDPIEEHRRRGNDCYAIECLDHKESKQKESKGKRGVSKRASTAITASSAPSPKQTRKRKSSAMSDGNSQQTSRKIRTRQSSNGRSSVAATDDSNDDKITSEADIDKILEAQTSLLTQLNNIPSTDKEGSLMAPPSLTNENWARYSSNSSKESSPTAIQTFNISLDPSSREGSSQDTLILNTSEETVKGSKSKTKGKRQPVKKISRLSVEAPEPANFEMHVAEETNTQESDLINKETTKKGKNVKKKTRKGGKQKTKMEENERNISESKENGLKENPSFSENKDIDESDMNINKAITEENSPFKRLVHSKGVKNLSALVKSEPEKYTNISDIPENIEPEALEEPEEGIDVKDTESNPKSDSSPIKNSTPPKGHTNAHPLPELPQLELELPHLVSKLQLETSQMEKENIPHLGVNDSKDLVQMTPISSPGYVRQTSDVKWSPINTDCVFEPINDVAQKAEFLNTMSQSSTVAELNNFVLKLPDEELDMTIEDWVKYNAEMGEKLLFNGCKSIVDMIRSEGEKAKEVLRNLPTEG